MINAIPINRAIFTGVALLLSSFAFAEGTRVTPIAEGWAKTSVNAVIFRKNSVVTHGNLQYVSFYDADGNVILAKRVLGTETWEIRKTRYSGKARDAHNSISIMVDGNGFLHMTWDHHKNPLNYCRSKRPGVLDLTDKMPMTGNKESRVTYPEFYSLPDGSLLFLYRDGASGRGNLMMNRYDPRTRTWTRVQDSILDGEDERNAYWQMCTDTLGAIHLSWVWRESGDVGTNHDICYAKSLDGGKTWYKSTGEKYNLPITKDNAEYALRIPQLSELMNQTSMCSDDKGRPYIANYWRPEGTDVPQYHVVYHDGAGWHTLQVSRRTTPFTLRGKGTKSVPISRPQIMADCTGAKNRAYMLFRDAERDNRVTVAICDDLDKRNWRFLDLTDFPVDKWEPTYDTELWKRDKILHVFLQKVSQGDPDAEPARQVSILEWKPE